MFPVYFKANGEDPSPAHATVVPLVGNFYSKFI